MSFYEKFKDNMESLGLPAPEGLFQTQGVAIATMAALARLIAKYGDKVTVREVVLLGPVWTAMMAGPTAASVSKATLEALLIAGAVAASAYLGACIGSLAVASGEHFSERLFKDDHYDWTLADQVCSYYGIPFVPCLMAKENRSFRRKK